MRAKPHTRVWETNRRILLARGGPKEYVSLEEAESECAAIQAEVRLLRSELHMAREELRELRADKERLREVLRLVIPRVTAEDFERLDKAAIDLIRARTKSQQLRDELAKEKT